MASSTKDLMNATDRYISMDNKRESYLHFKMKPFDGTKPLKFIKFICRDKHGPRGMWARNRHSVDQNR